MNRTELIQFYASGAEASRLHSGVAQLEAVRTRRLMSRFMPAAPACVVDVGGGAGAHAFWLAERGHTVHLLDPVPELIALARAANQDAEASIATLAVGDALDLPYGDATADALLMLGPLYHLTERSERHLALSEARRVLRPGGVLFAAAITRWAGALFGLTRGLYAQTGFHSQVETTLATGQNRNPRGLSGGFTSAYYHRPEELSDEIASAGFTSMTLHGLEGPACLLTDFDARWNDAEQRQVLEWAADTFGDEPSLLGASAHLLTVAYAPPRNSGTPADHGTMSARCV